MRSDDLRNVAKGDLVAGEVAEGLEAFAEPEPAAAPSEAELAPVEGPAEFSAALREAAQEAEGAEQPHRPVLRHDLTR